MGVADLIEVNSTKKKLLSHSLKWKTLSFAIKTDPKTFLFYQIFEDYF